MEVGIYKLAQVREGLAQTVGLLGVGLLIFLDFTSTNNHVLGFADFTDTLYWFLVGEYHIGNRPLLNYSDYALWRNNRNFSQYAYLRPVFGYDIIRHEKTNLPSVFGYWLSKQLQCTTRREIFLYFFLVKFRIK